MADYHGAGIGGLNQAPVAKASRINSDVERITQLTRSIYTARDRVQRQTSALGYFSDAPESAGDAGKIQPMVISSVRRKVCIPRSTCSIDPGFPV